MEAVISDDEDYFLNIAEAMWFVWYTLYAFKAKIQ
jgi:hypothetical protein